MPRPKSTEQETKTNPARGRTMADAREAALRGEISREEWAEAGFPANKYPTGGKAEAAPERTSKAKGRASEVDAEEAETKGARRAGRKKGETSLPAEQDGGEDESEQ